MQALHALVHHRLSDRKPFILTAAVEQKKSEQKIYGHNFPGRDVRDVLTYGRRHRKSMRKNVIFFIFAKDLRVNVFVWIYG